MTKEYAVGIYGLLHDFPKDLLVLGDVNYMLANLDFSHPTKKFGREFYNYDYLIIFLRSFYNHLGIAIQREKQIKQALKRGTTIIFLYDNFSILQDDKGLEPFKTILEENGLMTSPLPKIVTDCKIHRPEFEDFIDNYCAIKFIFDESEVEDRIASSKENDDIIACSKRYLKGRIIFLPFHFTEGKSEDATTNMFSRLVKAIIIYSDRIKDEISDWIKNEFVFTLEKPLINAESKLEKELNKLKTKRKVFETYKAILGLGNYSLQNIVSKFFNEILKIKTDKKDKDLFKEDFWILDKNGKKTVITEVKSTRNKNVGSGMIGQLIFHRSQYGKPDDFPALLIANTYLDATSLKKKDVKIEPNVRVSAVNNRVLITRTLDLLYFCDLLQLGKIKSAEIFKLIATQTGWLTVDLNSSRPKVLKK